MIVMVRMVTCLVSLAAATALAGCAGSTTAQTTPSGTSASASQPVTSAPPQSASPSQAGEEGCLHRENLTGVIGQTKNVKLQALATSIYAKLDCQGAQPLTKQLEAISKDPATAQQAKAVGATMDTQSVPQANAFTVKLIVITPAMAGCDVSAWDSPTKMKSVTCQDV